MIALLLAAQLGVIRPITLVEVCTTKWGADRRHVTLAQKKAVAKRDGVLWTKDIGKRVEFDHVIPRSLGGDDKVDNLKAQPWPQAYRKDARERALHAAVCKGLVTLADAQEEMRRWYEVHSR